MKLKKEVKVWMTMMIVLLIALHSVSAACLTKQGVLEESQKQGVNEVNVMKRAIAQLDPSIDTENKDFDALWEIYTKAKTEATSKDIQRKVKETNNYENKMNELESLLKSGIYGSGREEAIKDAIRALKDGYDLNIIQFKHHIIDQRVSNYEIIKAWIFDPSIFEEDITLDSQLQRSMSLEHFIEAIEEGRFESFESRGSFADYEKETGTFTGFGGETRSYGKVQINFRKTIRDLMKEGAALHYTPQDYKAREDRLLPLQDYDPIVVSKTETSQRDYENQRDEILININAIRNYKLEYGTNEKTEVLSGELMIPFRRRGLEVDEIDSIVVKDEKTREDVINTLLHNGINIINGKSIAEIVIIESIGFKTSKEIRINQRINQLLDQSCA